MLLKKILAPLGGSLLSERTSFLRARPRTARASATRRVREGSRRELRTRVRIAACPSNAARRYPVHALQAASRRRERGGHHRQRWSDPGSFQTARQLHRAQHESGCSGYAFSTVQLRLEVW